MTDEIPAPKQTEIDEAFWDAARDHEFRIQKCSNCGELRWPPTFICHSCWSEEVDWVEVSGDGEINSWVVFHHSYFEAFEEDVPYAVAEVQLAEGPRYIARIIDCEPDELYRGMEVTVVFDDVTSDLTLPKFVPIN